MIPSGIHYDSQFVTTQWREQLYKWLSGLHPIWEQRYSEHHPPPPGEIQRWLLRPIYWLGNWQFACLNYYHPPKGTKNRCVKAEPFPSVIQEMVRNIEKIVRRRYKPGDIPPGWCLNTCLVNFYGNILQNGKWIDTARVGEHKDFEPGPVASVSLGSKAMFQFVSSRGKGFRNDVVFQQWLTDGSLQIFGNKFWKEKVFHRVQRVDRKISTPLPLEVEGFRIRRINFTFRYVPAEHIIDYAALPENSGRDIQPYMEKLALHSNFFSEELKRAKWAKPST
jgi:DNA oxidative demethylase